MAKTPLSPIGTPHVIAPRDDDAAYQDKYQTVFDKSKPLPDADHTVHVLIEINHLGQTKMLSRDIVNKAGFKDTFLQEIERVCRRHGLSITDQDNTLPLLVRPLREEDIKKIMQAVPRT